jgi:heptosyltransferase I
MTEPRFLVLRLGSLGDIVHTFPAVAALRETFPDAEIVWLTHPRWKGLIESSGLCSQVWTTETRALLSLREIVTQVRQSHWDASIDYQGLWKSAALPFFGGVKRRIGFSSHTIREYGVPVLYTDKVRATTTHIADQNGELSVRAGSRERAACFSLRIPPHEEALVCSTLKAAGIERYVILSPGGGWRAKCWPPERFGLLCQQIRGSLGLRCIVNYGPGEEDLIAAVRASSGNADPLLYNSELGQLMALVRGAACIVGGDTGPLHLAIALGTRAVALFGPTDPARNGPYHVAPGPMDAVGHWESTTDGKKDIVLRADNTVTTHTRHDRSHPAMLAIDVESVFDAVRQQIGTIA